jgi:hypothetical protein
MPKTLRKTAVVSHVVMKKSEHGVHRVPISNRFVSTVFRSGSNFSEPQLVRVPIFGYRVPTVFQSCSKNRITVYNHVLPSINRRETYYKEPSKPLHIPNVPNVKLRNRD